MTMKFSGRRFFVACSFCIFCLNLPDDWFNVNAPGSQMFAFFVDDYLSVDLNQTISTYSRMNALYTVVICFSIKAFFSFSFVLALIET